MFHLPDITRWTMRRPASASRGDALDAFGSETTRSTSSGALKDLRLHPTAGVVVLTALPILLVGGFALKKWGPAVASTSVDKPFTVEASSASLTIESNPTGAEVHLAGTLKGTTPLTLNLPAGAHAVELVYGERRKMLSATATAGAPVVHHVELPAPPPPVERARPAARAVVPAPRAPAGPVAGWLSVMSPIAVQVIEDNEVIGTSETAKIMLRAGRHELRLVNADLGFSQQRTVEVGPGRNASLAVKLPNAPLSINAVPWAEAWIDGKRIGETPIGNHLVSIGPHEVVFRHPEFGERRQSVVVSLTKPARVSVDMRRPLP